MTVHQAYAVELGGSKISAISRQSVASNSEVNSDVDAGSPYPQSVTINAQRNQATWTTKDLEAALDELGSEGLAIGANSVKFWQLLLDDETGLIASGSVHRLLEIERGKTIPSRLTVEHQGDAELEAITHAIVDPTDSAALPMKTTESQAAPTGLAGDGRWTLKSVQVAGVELDCALRVEVDFGISITTEGCNSDIWDRSLIITEIKPVITITGKHLAKFAAASIPLIGKGGTHLDTSILLRKRLQSAAGFDPALTTSDIELTADCLAHWETVHDASGNNRVENRLRLDCRHDGTNVPLVIQTGVAA